MTNRYEGKANKFAIKIVVLGNYATGKTTLVTRLTTGKMRPFTESTIGCAFSSLSKISKHGAQVQYQIWDTAGQEKYRSMTELYYRNADIIMICFDVSNFESYNGISQWMNLINNGCHNKDNIKFLIANKDDLDWKVNKDEVIKLANENNLILVITSSLLNRGISELLDTIIEKSETTWREEMIHFSSTKEDTRIILADKNYDESSHCCY